MAKQRTLSSAQAHIEDDPLSSPPQDDQDWLIVDGTATPHSVTSNPSHDAPQ